MLDLMIVWINKFVWPPMILDIYQRFAFDFKQITFVRTFPFFLSFLFFKASTTITVSTTTTTLITTTTTSTANMSMMTNCNPTVTNHQPTPPPITAMTNHHQPTPQPTSSKNNHRPCPLPNHHNNPPPQFFYTDFFLGFIIFSTITVLRTGSGYVGDVWLGLELRLLLMQHATLPLLVTGDYNLLGRPPTSGASAATESILPGGRSHSTYSHPSVLKLLPK